MLPQVVDPVKLFMGVLYSDEVLLTAALAQLEGLYGPIDYRSEPWPFEVSDYYVPEMGSPIWRIFIGFRRLMGPQDIVRIKLETNEVEAALSSEGLRKVNLDPGYLDYDKVVLASAKYNGQKVYLDHGIWADLTLRYEKGKFYPYPWSFPDFKSETYYATFLALRQTYKTAMRDLKQNPRLS